MTTTPQPSESIFDSPRSSISACTIMTPGPSSEDQAKSEGELSPKRSLKAAAREECRTGTDSAPESSLLSLMHALLDEAYSKNKSAFNSILKHSCPVKERTSAGDSDDLSDSTKWTESRPGKRTKRLSEQHNAWKNGYNRGLDRGFDDALRQFASCGPPTSLTARLLATSGRPLTRHEKGKGAIDLTTGRENDENSLHNHTCYLSTCLQCQRHAWNLYCGNAGTAPTVFYVTQQWPHPAQVMQSTQPTQLAQAMQTPKGRQVGVSASARAADPPQQPVPQSSATQAPRLSYQARQATPSATQASQPCIYAQQAPSARPDRPTWSTSSSWLSDLERDSGRESGVTPEFTGVPPRYAYGWMV